MDPEHLVLTLNLDHGTGKLVSTHSHNCCIFAQLQKTLAFLPKSRIIEVVVIDMENEMIVIEMLFLVVGVIALALIMNPMDID
jgi:hypothetical protein